MTWKTVLDLALKPKSHLGQDLDQYDIIFLAQNVSAVQLRPVCLLNSLYVRKGITPKYDLVKNDGQTFTCYLSVGELEATGCGQSKKKAKHTAAKSMMGQLNPMQQQSTQALQHFTGLNILHL